ncbi:MAG: hypothetical protein C0501_17600 [Isosphaera sp.]|nr:hypothetical protein [Isosphaera sp.]
MAHRKRARIDDRDTEAQAVAWLVSRGHTQQDIAKSLGLSQAAVSRLKDRAVEKKWLETTTTLNLSAEECKRAKERLAPGSAKLLAKLEGLARGTNSKPVGVRVFDSGGDATDPEGHDKRLRRFAGLAAGDLAELLYGARTVGVTWGKTLNHLVEALKSSRPEWRPVNPLRFVPLSGVLLNDPYIRFSSTSLVARLHGILNGRQDPPLSLAAVPARIPAKFYTTGQLLTDEQQSALRLYVTNIPGHHRIFGGTVAGAKSRKSSEKPLVELMDSMVTSVGGDYSRSADPWREEMLHSENLTKHDLDQLALGDINGVFLPRPDAARELADINTRCTGATLDHIRRCARDAAANSRPGVILTAIGKGKAEVVERCIREGLVNQLLIDHDLSQALADRLPG